MKYQVTRSRRYDFVGEKAGANLYPNLHQYPAIMIPQIGIEILKEFKITGGHMLDPYCGSGSSFAAGIEVGIKNFTGFDINPLALLICKSRFTYLDVDKLGTVVQKLERRIMRIRGTPNANINVSIEKFNNFDYWFSEKIGRILQWLKEQIILLTADDKALKNFLLVPLSATVRKCSYVRKNEFKLYRMKEEDMLSFEPPVLEIFVKTARYCMLTYNAYYKAKSKKLQMITNLGNYESTKQKYNTILTSPPYGDSKTTVAYGQFSLFANAWLLEDENARAIDNRSMGGRKSDSIYIDGSLINDCIKCIDNVDHTRAREVAAFYQDLKKSIHIIAKSLLVGGKAIYVVGNRTVKNQTLPTDQFIAECFEESNCLHKVTYKRAISNKYMPSLNSPSNKAGEKVTTMNSEFIVVCEKYS